MSMIPALAPKTYQLCGSTAALESNVRTAVQGCGFKSYPLEVVGKSFTFLYVTFGSNDRTYFSVRAHTRCAHGTHKEKHGQGKVGSQYICLSYKHCEIKS